MRFFQAFVQWTGGFEGSTRPAALMRMGLAMLAWARYAEQFIFYKRMEWDYFLVGTSFYLSTTLMFFGIFSRFSTAWAGLTLLGGTYHYLGFAKEIEPFTHHHTYLICFATCLLSLTPCGRSYSFDRWWVVRRAEKEGRPPPPERGPLWGQRLIALQIAAVYFWGAYDKTYELFLSGESMEFVFMTHYLGSDYPEGSWFHLLMVALSWGTVILEYALAVGLFIPRLRPWMILSGILFHGILYITLPVATFSLTMWLLYLAFLDPDGVHRALDKMAAPAPAPG